MTETDIVHIGDPLPAIGRVVAVPPSSIEVTWTEGERAGRTETVDLAPMMFGRKLFRALHDDADFFATVHVIADGDAIAWGDDDTIDLSAATVERLAEEVMTPTDFKAFLDRNGLSFDAAAAQLGISRRLVAYYASGRDVPRYIALACKYLERKEGCRPAITAPGAHAQHSDALPSVPDLNLPLRSDRPNQACPTTST
jgi:DNA-binding transcriptional regulator YiaG